MATLRHFESSIVQIAIAGSPAGPTSSPYQLKFSWSNEITETIGQRTAGHWIVLLDLSPISKWGILRKMSEILKHKHIYWLIKIKVRQLHRISIRFTLVLNKCRWLLECSFAGNGASSYVAWFYLDIEFVKKHQVTCCVLFIYSVNNTEMTSL